MKGFRVLAVLLLALLLGSAAQSHASASAELISAPGPWETTYVGTNPVFQWTSTACWPDCEATIEVEFNGLAGGGDWFQLAGPPEQDPLVSQTVLNSSGVTWLDWHVDIRNWLISRTVDAPRVHKVEADASNWEISYIHNAGYTDGFGARWIGGNTAVATGQRLSIRFRWSPDGSGLPVAIQQYPTDTGEFIPEPSSLFALVSGLGSFGFALYRRRK
jgi:hypothetical protein